MANLQGPPPLGPDGTTSPAWQRWFAALPSKLNGDTSGLQAQITSLQGQVASLNSDVTTLQADMTAVEAALVAAEAQLLAERTTNVQSPGTGFTIVVANATSLQLLTPAGVLATGTLTMPTAPPDGFEVQLASTFAVTALTLTPSAGQSISGTTAFALAAHTRVVLRWRAATNTWYRLQ